MSYHNLLICIPEHGITKTCVQQHAVLVDYLIGREFKREKWYLLATQFYPALVSNKELTNEMLSHRSTQEKDSKDVIHNNSAMLKDPNDNEGNRNKPSIEIETSKKTSKMPMWIDKERMLRIHKSSEKVVKKELSKRSRN